jgi:uncharacterized repeat protein (TIGR03803 family)
MGVSEPADSIFEWREVGAQVMTADKYSGNGWEKALPVMKSPFFIMYLAAVSAAVGVLCSLAAAPAVVASIHDIYVFQGGTDGQFPSSGLIADAQGRLYGATSQGGASNYGTVYRLTPPAAGQTQWTEEILHSFSLSDGALPSGTLVMDAGGNLYGTTSQAGPTGIDGAGTVFKLNNVSGWPLTVLHDFGSGINGGHPSSGVIFGPSGLLYGVTADFGNKTPAQSGTLFSVSTSGDAVEFSVLHDFGKLGFGTNGDGFLPTGLREIDQDTLIGSCLESYGPAFAGDIYEQKITPKGQDPYAVAYFFNKAPDVGGPGMPPLPETGNYQGVYFGTAQNGGAYSNGGIYTIVPSNSGGVDENVIYSFGSRPNDTMGSGAATLIQIKSSGVLDGTSNAGGAYGQGTLFELDPPSTACGSWTEKILVDFESKESSLGGAPQGTLLRIGSDIFGAVETTNTGYGAIYKLSNN